MHDSISLNDYFQRYFISYIGIFLALNIAKLYLFPNMGKSLAMAVIIGAGIATAYKFVKDNDRVPNAREKNILAAACTAIHIACTIGFIMLHSFTSAPHFLSSLGTFSTQVQWFIPMLLLLGVGVPFIALRWIFGRYSAIALKQLEKEAQKNN